MWELYNMSLLTRGTPLRRGILKLKIPVILKLKNLVHLLCFTCNTEIKDANHLCLYYHVTQEYIDVYAQLQVVKLLHMLSSVGSDVSSIKMNRLVALSWSI